MAEFAPKSHHAAMGTIWNILEGSEYIFLTIYYRYISKKWQPTMFWALFQCTISIVVVLLYIPESPKFLYGKKKYK